MRIHFAIPFIPVILAACGPEPAPDRPTPGSAGMEAARSEALELLPAQTVLRVGESLELELRLRGGEESEAEELEVTWQSSRPSVVSVSRSGQVRALAPGDAEIWARVSGVRVVSRVRVVEADAADILSSRAAPAAERPALPAEEEEAAARPDAADEATELQTPDNLPTGFAEVSRQRWNRLGVEGWTAAWNHDGFMSVVTDSSVPEACCTVLEHRYPAGFEGGRGPASVDYNFGPSRRVFVSTWWKANEGWQGHRSGVNKLLFIFPRSAPGNWYIGWYYTGALRVAPQRPGGWQWLEPNVDDSRLRAGQWHRIEWQLEHESGTRWTVRWWVDGTLRGNHQGVEWVDADLALVKLNPTWGGTGDRKEQDDYFRWAGTSISVSRTR